MTDLESTLSVALRDAAEGAPRAVDLAGHARGRLRRRRRTTAVVVVAAAAVVAIPVGVQVARQSAGPDVAGVPSDWRTESYRNLTLQVPPDWTYEGGPDWCVEGPLDQVAPAVSRGEGFRADVACRPRLGYGVIFEEGHVDAADRPAGLPADASVDLVGTGRAHAWIVAESPEQLGRIRDTFAVVDGIDANGCRPEVDPDAEGSGDRVSVCRYDSGQLEQSELLSSADSAVLRDAIADAPLDESFLRACDLSSYDQPKITLRSSEVVANILPSPTCFAATFFESGTGIRVLTGDVLYWALSPGVSLPPTVRQPVPVEPRTLD